MTDLDNVIDNIFNHPNVGPFLSQAVDPAPGDVESQPAIRRARGAEVQQQRQRRARRHEGGRPRDPARQRGAQPDRGRRSRHYGKLTEPVVRFVQLHRAFNAQRARRLLRPVGLRRAQALNQSPLHAPSVFNFYHPGFHAGGSAAGDRPRRARSSRSPMRRRSRDSPISASGESSTASITTTPTPASGSLPDYSYYLGIDRHAAGADRRAGSRALRAAA